MLKTNYNANKTKLEKKIPDVTDFVKKAKLTELENNFPDISNLATKAALTAVENKIPYVSNLVKTTDYNTEVSEIENKLNNHNHEKYIDTAEFNKLPVDVFNGWLAQANLVSKADFDDKLSNLNKKVTKNKTNHLLVQNELKKLKTFDSTFFNGKSYFEEDGRPSYLLFQPLNKYFKVGDSNLHYVLSWTSKGLFLWKY